nr:ATP-dependent sacrificial sulfur transferase LarE [Caloramator mitchellensis]
METNEKLQRLKDILKDMGSVMVALSGGIDSSFLLKVAHDVLGNRAVAGTAVSYIYPSWEINEAREFAKEIGVEHVEIEYDPLLDVEEFKYNPIDRCYICKKAVFSRLVSFANESGINYVVDGTNADDLKDYRPGLKAVEELGVKSPLLMAGLTKQDIREIARKMGLKFYDKPSYACLATRIPYNEEVNKIKLKMIDMAEIYLIEKGFKNVRVRCHGDIARIEVPKSEIPKFFNMNLIEDVENKLKELGFKYVSLDLTGYKTGSLNLGVKG